MSQVYADAVPAKGQTNLPGAVWPLVILVFLLVAGLPVAAKPPERSIVIDVRTHTLELRDGSGKVLKTYSVATGRGSLTPLGDFRIVNAAKQPAWYYHGKVVPGGTPANPLGSRWLGLSWVSKDGNRVGIHGTNAPNSIGKSVSNGCIRMQNKSVEELFALVGVGTPVKIIRSSEPPKTPAASPAKGSAPAQATAEEPVVMEIVPEERVEPSDQLLMEN